MASKALLVDETVREFVSSLPEKGIGTGIIVGQTTEASQFVLLTVPTPSQTDAPSQARSCSDLFQPAASEWINEHATQVARMLIGGLRILGLFVHGPSPSLGNVLKDETLHRAVSSLPKLSTDPLVLLIDHSKQMTFSRLSFGERAQSSKPASASPKYTNLFSNFRLFVTSFSVDSQICVNASKKASGPSQLIELIEKEISPTSQQISSSVVSIEGKLNNPNESIEKALSKKPENGIHSAMVLCPISQKLSTTDDVASECIRFDLRGCLSGFAYLHSSTLIGNATAAIKEDLSNSLKDRLETLFTELTLQAEDSGDSKVDSLLKPLSVAIGELRSSSRTWQTPRRVLIRLGNGRGWACDYVFPHETAKDVEERFNELLSKRIECSGAGTDFDASVFQESFQAKHVSSSSKKQGKAPSVSQSVDQQQLTKPSGGPSILILIAVIVAVIAATVALAIQLEIVSL